MKRIFATLLGLLLVHSVFAANWTYVETGNLGIAGGTNPSLPTGHAQDDLIILGVMLRANGRTMTGNCPATWSELDAIGTGPGILVCAKIEGASESAPALPVIGGTNTEGFIMGFRGGGYTDMATIVAHHNEASTATNTADVPNPALTITTDNTLVVCFANKAKTATSNSATATSPTGCTNRAKFYWPSGTTMGRVLDYNQQTTATSISASIWNQSVEESLAYSSIILSLKTASAGGVFDTTPSVATQSETAFTSITGSLDASGTVDAVLCHIGNVPANDAGGITKVQGGLCADSSAALDTDTASPSTGNFDFDLALGTSLALPEYGIGVTDGDSVTILDNEFLDVPSGYGQTVLASVDAGSLCKQHNDAAIGGTLAAGSVIEFPLDTDPALPMGVYFTVDNDCGAGYIADGDFQRRINGPWSEYISGASLDADPITAVFFDQDVVVTEPGGYNLVMLVNTALGMAPNPDAPILWDDGTSGRRFCYHPLGDAITVTLESGSVSGLSLMSGVYSGIPDTEVEGGTPLTFRCTSDVTGTYTDQVITAYPITSLTVAIDCPTDTLSLAECEAQFDALPLGALTYVETPDLCAPTPARNIVTSQSPDVMAELAPYGTVTLGYARGPCGRGQGLPFRLDLGF